MGANQQWAIIVFSNKTHLSNRLVIPCHECTIIIFDCPSTTKIVASSPGLTICGQGLDMTCLWISITQMSYQRTILYRVHGSWLLTLGFVISVWLTSQWDTTSHSRRGTYQIPSHIKVQIGTLPSVSPPQVWSTHILRLQIPASCDSFRLLKFSPVVSFGNLPCRNISTLILYSSG